MKSQSLARAASVSTPSPRQEAAPETCSLLVKHGGRAIYACMAADSSGDSWRFLAYRQEGRRTDGTCLPRALWQESEEEWAARLEPLGRLAGVILRSRTVSPRGIALASPRRKSAWVESTPACNRLGDLGPASVPWEIFHP